MNPSQIAETIRERFERWGNFLAREDATPTVVIGLGWPGPRRKDHEITICCPEGMPDGEIIKQLRVAIALIRAGKTDYR